MQSFYHKITARQNEIGSYLCVGLDSDLDKIPAVCQKEPDPIYSFNCSIIEATSDLVCAYKPNIAFYEKEGLKGLKSLKKTLEYIPEEIPVIIDAKRADIGNTSLAYAKAFFQYWDADAITVSPYMGGDSIIPFLSFAGKGIFILAKTSNQGSSDFQDQNIGSQKLYQKVVDISLTWGNYEQLGFVVGATYPEEMKKIRAKASSHLFLVPGIGAQGGELEKVLSVSGNKIIINSSRSIIFASQQENYADQAREKAIQLKNKINKGLRK